MERNTDEISLPAFVRRLLPAAIGLPLGPVLTLSLRSFARRRPEIFERLGAYCSARYLIDPTDLPFAFIVVPNGVSATVQITSGSSPVISDVVLRGPIMALLGILDGTFDGDALFFHRTISITGRTEAIVALRNAIEDAELRPSDLLGLKGMAAHVANSAILGGFDVARGVAMSAAHHQKERA
ncbi:lipid carrier protein-like protein [Hyphomicrobium denitrificans 1NES1]|uniref:Lipid carrier protein-like protein n=1 Tax=Hyphomicrobium denitrificans 1NES1 TaxID=670307 RepID=N0B9J8_9HYPH|nr:lipid carrier [Hyphomicrobium denitrificans]AGK56765.1 lipid carrier protein-like protein [Hyphomicrobium denitrificans 1NES1]